MPNPLLIVGASTRAAAFSALAGGYEPICIDFFADLDLRERCRVRRVEEYPGGLPALAEELPAAPWMYTGALENYPDVIAAISQHRPLWGNSPVVLSEARSPERLAELLTGPDWMFPHWQRTAPANRPGTWLIKADRSAGGAQIQRWSHQHAASSEKSGRYYQQLVQGTSCAAVYVAARGSARLLGVSQQLIGIPWAGASGFRYSGSVGPLPLTDAEHRRFAQLGEQLAAAYSLEGLFGVDLVIGDDVGWVIEINPRYTASMEVLERAGGFSAVACHAAACRDGTLPDEPVFSGGWHGKVILYTRRETAVPDELVSRALAANEQLPLPATADIPAPQSPLRAGWPVMTLLERAADRASLLTRLQSEAASWQRLLEGVV